MVRRILAMATAATLFAGAMVGSSLPAAAVPPSAATNVTAVQTGLYAIDVTWNLPAANPENPVVSIGVATSRNGQTWSDWGYYYPPDTTTYSYQIDYRDRVGDHLQFRVRVLYTTLEDSISAASEPLVITGAASPPVNVKQVDPGHGTVTMTWDPPLTDGGTPITEYKVYRRYGTEVYDATWFYLGSVAADDPLTFTDHLWGFGTNEYSITAHNKWGDAFDTTFTRGVSWFPANAPERVTAKKVQGGWLLLTFTPGQLRVGEREGYEISDGHINATVEGWYGVTSPVRAYFPATAGRSTTLHIRGWNAFKASASAYDLTVTPGDVPGSPRIGRALVSHGNVKLSWRPPSSDGYSPIKTYRVTVIDSGKTFSVPGSARYVVIKKLARGKRFAFSVVAVNAIGTSAPATTHPILITGN